MQLTTQQLSGIVVSLQGNTSKTGSGHEKRRFSRIEVHAKIAAASLAGGAAVRLYSALTRDISFTGMGLTQARACQSGDRIAIRLPCGSKTVIAVSCTVMHCRALADGIYGVGLQFTELLPPDFVEKAAQSPEMKMQRIRESILG